MSGSARSYDAKRVVDVAVAALGLLLTWPLLAVVGLAVRLDSPGPALFRQVRIGLHGEPFRIHKFRSMRLDTAGPLLSAAGDPRVTRVGLFLRRHKLDELPQLIDVLAGRMSLVGPRPELPEYVEQWPTASRAIILSVRPGITDPASIALRHEADELSAADDPESFYVDTLLPRKVEMYVDYVRRRSLRGDVLVIGRTLAAIVRG